jgi:hypothetical protein
VVASQKILSRNQAAIDEEENVGPKDWAAPAQGRTLISSGKPQPRESHVAQWSPSASWSQRYIGRSISAHSS